MSDFGFDAYALDDLDTSGQTHPLEIARDLIASGRPRAALDLLSDHHDQLVDDPEYLLLCSAAWWADGDTLRAQQALQGAARLAPGDPRPLQGLGELLAERGEHDKAELLLAKARALEVQAIENELSMDEMGTEAADDLIAFAERRDRKTQGALTPRQVLLGIVVLLGLALLIAAIVLVTSPRKAASPPRDAAPSTTTNLAEEPAAWDVAEELEEPPTVTAAEKVEELLPVEVAEPPVLAVLDRPTKEDLPKRETARAEAASPVPSHKAAPTRRRPAPATSASRKDAAPPLVQPPSDTVVQA
ncbi:MAG: tetratricopeptide repeat protein, partial [Polyangiales bacterium]